MQIPRIVVVGGGFGGFHVARRLRRRLGPAAEIVILSTTNYFLYMPLLPQAAGGLLDPRRVAVSLTSRLPGVRLVPGEAQDIDFDRRRVQYVNIEERQRELEYDQLVIATGSIHKLLPIPGVAEFAHGFRGVPEALYLRDELIRQMELAGASDDPAERAARTTFVVVGAGYTGTEVAAQGHLLTRAVAKRHRGLRGVTPRWLLVDIADRVLPELDERLAKTATRVLTRRGIEVRTGTSVAEATAEGVVLSDGEEVPTRTLAWCVGVRPDPLVESLGLPTEQGRLVVDEYLTVPSHPEVSAVGDVAAVPDLTRPGSITPMTAQHAVRQAKRAAGNIAASYGWGTRRPYRHHDRGFVVDLGGVQAAANPFGVALGGPLATLVTHGYHLSSIPANRLRIALDWLLTGLTGRQTVQLGLVHAHDVPLETASPELAAHRHQ